MIKSSILFLYRHCCSWSPPTNCSFELCITRFQMKRSNGQRVMFSQLRNFLISGGIFQDEKQPSTWANLRQLLTVLFAVISMGSYFVGGFVYSFKYQDIVDAVKTASYAYNNIFSVLLSYLYIVFNRNELKQLIDARNSAIIKSWVVVLSYRFLLRIDC